MKRITAIALVLMLLVCSFAACGGTQPEAPEVVPYEGAIAELVTKLYDTYSVGELPVFKEGMPVDLTDADAVKSYTGLDSADGVAEVVFSETMMGSQAFSLVIAKLSDAAKAEEIKKAMFEGINTRKWICVEADKLRVVSSADLVMLVMVDSQLGEGHADGLVEAFKTNVGELTGETLTKG
ncbi:MAG: hypothetical protein IJB93_04110 [Clostridia bacterium]|nr:hypothetical protein [Clostridia bacterium]